MLSFFNLAVKKKKKDASRLLFIAEPLPNHFRRGADPQSLRRAKRAKGEDAKAVAERCFSHAFRKMKIGRHLTSVAADMLQCGLITEATDALTRALVCMKDFHVTSYAIESPVAHRRPYSVIGRRCLREVLVRPAPDRRR